LGGHAKSWQESRALEPSAFTDRRVAVKVIAKWIAAPQGGPAMVAKVFISYRRGDSSGHAGRVHDRRKREFGRDLLFMDVDAIPLGAKLR
jgi:hypothetical protein